MNRVAAVFAVLLSILPLSACAGDCVPQVRAGWIRSGPAQMPMLAGFGRIENPCSEPLVVVGASSPAFADVSLHETRIVAGVSRMRAVPALRVAPDAVAILAPGGLHLMLMRPLAPLQPGDAVVIEFALQDGGVLRGDFEVL